MRVSFFILLLLVATGCSTKKNNLFTRQYHQLTTRYNVYFNGNEALKAGIKKMDERHKEDYTNLLPVFVSNNEQTRSVCASDMDYAIEKAVKAIDKHSITAKPRRKKNKDSKSYETYRKKKEFNNQLSKCYMLLGKSYFYKQKYAMANNTFRFIQRQYADDEKIMTELNIWMFRSNTEAKRYDEAAKFMNALSGAKLNKKQQEMYAAAKTDFYVRQGNYGSAIGEGEQLLAVCKSMKRKPRYNFIMSQLYLKENQDAQAMAALKKVVKFNFKYEMVFNAKINMALAYQAGDESIKKKLNKMLKDSRNKEYQDRIYYALGNIEEKKGDEPAAIDLYWKSVRTSVDNDNQKSLSFFKLGEYYFNKERDYRLAQSCYDSCMYFMDSRFEDYDRLKALVTDLTELVVNLNTIQEQDSLQHLAALPEAERNNLVDGIIQKIKDKENEAKELERQTQQERNFFMQNDMISRGNNALSGNNSSNGGEWYFYNPVTIALGKNDFKRKWGRRRLEDNWRRQNKAMVDFGEQQQEVAENGDEKKNTDTKSRDFYLQNVPLTEESLATSKKKVEDACYKAGEIYMYKFNDYTKALECFEIFINRFGESASLPMVYYLAYESADKGNNPEKAEKYKTDLILKFPDSDFAKGLLDPEYFKKVDNQLRVVNAMYEEAFEKYRNIYYDEALSICDDIIRRFPDNKLQANVLFLRAMCMVNTCPPMEAREALNAVLAAKPDADMKNVITSLLGSLDVGDTPIVYSGADMADARSLRANRNWVFGQEEEIKEDAEDSDKIFKVEKDKEYWVVIMLPEEMKKMHTLQMQGRLSFINASDAVGKTKVKSALKTETEKGIGLSLGLNVNKSEKLNVDKEDLWYKHSAFVIKSFENYEQAETYLNRIGTDRVLLKQLGNENYRMFAITPDNMSLMKRLKNSDVYTDFFINNYFEDKNKGEVICGKQGASAHIFTYEENEKHDFVLFLPYREVNTKKIAEMLISLEQAFRLEREDYDDQYEMIVVKSIGAKTQAIDYMNLVLKDKNIFDRLAGVEYESFIITQNNLKILIENQNIDQYLRFFNDNYLKMLDNAATGVEDGDFIYNKGLEHKFVLVYSNTVDPFKLKAVFDDFNFAGLKMNNARYDETNDCMIVSGFGSKDEAMRYFDTMMKNRKLFKPLKNTDYRNFIITEGNLTVMVEKKLLESYLLFFKKYYLSTR